MIELIRLVKPITRTNKNCKSQPLVIEQCLQVKKQNEQICKNQNWFNKEKVYSSIEF